MRHEGDRYVLCEKLGRLPARHARGTCLWMDDTVPRHLARCRTVWLHHSLGHLNKHAWDAQQPMRDMRHDGPATPTNGGRIHGAVFHRFHREKRYMPLTGAHTVTNVPHPHGPASPMSTMLMMRCRSVRSAVVSAVADVMETDVTILSMVSRICDWRATGKGTI